MENYSQLCGALGILRQNGEPLNWVAINEQMRDLGRRLGVAMFGDPIANTPPTGWSDPVHEEIRGLLRQYRDMCIERGLIERGYLFSEHDRAPLL